jgi:pyruvate/2-oxoglutarate dehydrogenase complex dihydrolipoamide acyltransferase (E2) component
MDEPRRDPYEVRPYPRLRRFSIDTGHLARRRSMMSGLAEVDVTEIRRAFRAHKERTGEAPSFTAYIVACLARAVEENREVQAWRDWRGRLVIFDDVNINVIVEVDSPQGKIALPHIVRAANRKTFRQIHDEIRAVQAAPGRTEEQRFLSWFLWLPGPLRRLIESALVRFPLRTRRLVTPILVTSVGMFGAGAFWGLTPADFPLLVVLGGTVERPRLADGRLENREMLCVTLSLDHVIVDGAPAARFGRRFRELVEAGQVSLGPEGMAGTPE